MMWPQCWNRRKKSSCFKRNLLKCAGRGPSAGVRDAKDRAQQIQWPEDFANIFDDEDDVLLEANQGNNPDMHIPMARSKHRTPKKRFSTKPPGKHQQEKGKSTKKKCDETCTTRKLALAMEVTDSELTTGWQNRVDNPPMLVSSSWRIVKC